MCKFVLALKRFLVYRCLEPTAAELSYLAASLRFSLELEERREALEAAMVESRLAWSGGLCCACCGGFVLHPVSCPRCGAALLLSLSGEVPCVPQA